MLRRIGAMIVSAVYSISIQGGLSGAPPDNGAAPSFLFPAALEIIEDSAFVSTGASRLVFGESLREIGEEAFFGTVLREIFLPAAQTSIADSAFPSSPDTILHGMADSTAQQWAARHSLAFVPDGGTPGAGGGRGGQGSALSIGLRAVVYDSRRPLRPLRDGRSVEISMRPQDRPELNPIDYRFP